MNLLFFIFFIPAEISGSRIFALSSLTNLFLFFLPSFYLRAWIWIRIKLKVQLLLKQRGAKNLPLVNIEWFVKHEFKQLLFCKKDLTRTDLKSKCLSLNLFFLGIGRKELKITTIIIMIIAAASRDADHEEMESRRRCTTSI